jgi:hypothetical protein
MYITMCVGWGKSVYLTPNMDIPCEPKSKAHRKIKVGAFFVIEPSILTPLSKTYDIHQVSIV